MSRATRPLHCSSRLALVLALAGSLFAAGARADYPFNVYTGTWTTLPNFDALTPVSSGTSSVIDLSVTTRTSSFGIQFTGTLTVPVAATYTFATTSDEGSDLRIDSTTVVNNDGVHTSATVSGSIALSAGTHSLRVRYFERSGAQTLSVAYTPPGGTSKPLPPANGALEGPPSPNLMGSWGPVLAWPHIPISIANLPDGRIPDLVVDRDQCVPERHRVHPLGGLGSEAPARSPPPTATSTTCSARACPRSRTGRIVAAGGNPYDTRVSAFNPSSLTWGALANLNENRWYGTLLELPSDELFSTFANAAGDVSERYSPPNNFWIRTPGAPMTDLLNEQNAKNGQSGANGAGGSSGGARWPSHPTAA